ncbi:unnamed protein product, partial [Brassica oleracea var. botrytis]
ECVCVSLYPLVLLSSLLYSCSFVLSFRSVRPNGPTMVRLSVGVD